MEATAWGTIDAEGNPINKGSGNWSVTRQGVGIYRVKVQGALGGSMVVVVSGYREALTADANDPGQDNTYSTRVLNTEEFEVYSYDTGQVVTGERQNAAFSFFAVWRRV